MSAGKNLYYLENSITPHSAVKKGLIGGKRSNEVKVKVLLMYGDVIKKMILSNRPYSIIYENNGLKKRQIFNVYAKRVSKNSRIFYLKNIDANKAITDPTLTLALDSTGDYSNLRVSSTRTLKSDFSKVEIEKRYKFPTA